jgi:hypothetical protein
MVVSFTIPLIRFKMRGPPGVSKFFIIGGTS